MYKLLAKSFSVLWTLAIILPIAAAFLFSPPSMAAVDTCVKDGGTAACIGPDVGQWEHHGRLWSIPGAIVNGSSESDVIANLTARIAQENPCTVDVANNLPPYLQTVQPSSGCDEVGDSGNALYGSGTAQYASSCWILGISRQQFKAPLRFTGTTGANCYGTSWGNASVDRGRAVACKPPYQPNTTVQPNSYCYRPASTVDPDKNLGDQCCLEGNPVNVTTGNKYQSETDYVGANGSLTFARHYNSGAWKGPSAPTNDGRRRSALGPNWTSNYDRAIVFVDTSFVSTAAVYRPNGRILYFTFYNGQYRPDADIADRLAKVVNGSGELVGWTYTVAAGDLVESYDAAGKLVSVSERGYTLHLAYTDDRLSSVTNSFGSALNFYYDLQGRLSYFTDPSGASYVYAYNGTNNVASLTSPGGAVRTYLYNEPAHTGGANLPYSLTGIVDEHSVRFATFQYDSSNRVTLSEHAGGVERRTFVYTATNTQVTDALTSVITHTVLRSLGMARVSNVARPGFSSTRAFDAQGNISYQGDFKGNRACFAYDLNRNLETFRVEGIAAGVSCPADLSSYTPAPGTRQRKIATQWHATFRLPLQVTEAGKLTTFTYDSAGNLLSSTLQDAATGASRTWIYTYNAFGKVLTENGPRTDVNDVTTYTYYSCTTGFQCGQVQAITNAAGHVTTYHTYNAHGQPLTISDPNGAMSTLTYDARQRLTSRTVGSEVTSFTYWPTGLLRKATLPDASYVEYTYDSAHRLSEIQDSQGNRIVYILDDMGNRTSEQSYDPSNTLARTRTKVFDTLSRLQHDIGAAGTTNVTTTYGYDVNDNQTSIAAPLSRNGSQTYDELNRLTQVTNPGTGVTKYGYNALDQLVSVTDPRSLVTSYAYNAFGDLQQQTSPDTGVTTNTYDSGGNLGTSTDARTAITTHTYDALNRVTSSAYKVGTTTDQAITYTYDAGSNGKGRLTGASDSNHSLSWTYDDQGRILTAGQAVGTVSKTTSYAYSSGLRQSMTTPSGQFVTYSYNNGKITGISVNGVVLVSNILYDPFGPVRQWTWGNGSLAVRTFDLDGKVTQIDSAGLKTYTYDDAFRITGITDTTNAALSWTYGYNNLDRVTSASKTGTTLGYTYDANGNRLTQTGSSASSFTIAPNSNRLSSTAGTLGRTYGYDNSGNTTSFTGITFAYNNRGRMKSSTKSGVTTNYVYNAAGQLVKKGTNTLYYYDQAGHIIGVYTSSGALTEEIVWLGDIPIISLRPKTGGGINIYNIHTDHLNTPRLITGSVNPDVRWRWDTDPFGVGTPNNNPSGAGAFDFNLRFPGQIYFAEMGLNHNYYRDYDPATGRYAQSDPVGLTGGINTFTYVFGNPLELSDPMGLLVWRNSTMYSNNVSSGDYRPYPGSPSGYFDTSDTGGFTLVDWKIESLCECKNDKYVFNEFLVNFITIVHIRQGNSQGWTDWSYRAEGDHVRDFNSWANGAARKIALEREGRYRSSNFSSLEQCQRVTSESLSNALTYGGIREVLKETIKAHDNSGRHDYANPNRRP